MEQPKTSTGYNAPEIEPKWYAAWEEAGLFEPDADTTKPSYSITIPPPNITGSLHMGHALCYGLQDLLGRYKRLRGFRVMILPGQDHAGIAAQSVVGKNLRKQGVNPSALGREKFIEKVWEWRHESGDTILRQFRKLGCAFAWSRLRFTLDDAYVHAVYKVFIEWFDRGLIYKGLRVVNWDPVLKTSISDIETERMTVKGKLYHIAYPFADGSGTVTIATTRPETMLADVAVAVHPKDSRYQGLVGKELVLPLVGRRIPLIADEYPDPEFGTGAVKITPAHDANDFEVGQRHNLPVLIMMDPDGKVSEMGGIYAGLDRVEARKRIVADLEAGGHLVKIDDHEIPILISDRSKEVIEPLASEQWFVRQKELAEPAIKAVEDGRISFFPDRYNEIYLDWMKNIRDWNISRQLWWGHRIPVYYTESGTAVAALSWEEAEAKAGEKIVRQDDDVLDTWFSSGLWPFATMGWPESTDDLKGYYPTDVLVTARDIIYLWLARMIMMGIDFVDKIPFRDVFVYATVLTEDGKRMSKSLGTGVDPLEVIDTKGADALRYALFSQTGLNQDIRYGERRSVDGRNFCSKVWNATRFVTMNMESEPAEPSELEVADQWILSRLVRCEQLVREGYEGYDIQGAMSALYEFFWSELCDWYLEVCKSRLQNPATKAVPQWVMLRCIEAFLTMLHPALPFVTEEVYSTLPLADKSPFLMASKWPELPTAWLNPSAEASFGRCIEVTRAIRALRAECGVGPGQSVAVAFYEGDLAGIEEFVRTQSWLGELRHGRPESDSVSATIAGVDVHLPLEGLIDKDKERQRLTKELEKIETDLNKVNGQLDNPQFRERANPQAIAKLETQLAELKDREAKTRERLKVFGG